MRYGSPEYWCWQGLKKRCYNINNARYPRYGGRGVTVCDRWLDNGWTIERTLTTPVKGR